MIMAHWCTSLVLVILPLLMECRGKEDVYPFGSNKVLEAKSPGLPIELTCEDNKSPRIQVSGITLDYNGDIITAEDKYPRIQHDAQKDCERTHTMPTASRPAGCRIELPGLGIPNTVGVITVFWCYLRVQSRSAIKNHIASSDSVDVKIKCYNKDIINIRDIRVDNEPVADFKLLKEKCRDQMLKSMVKHEDDSSKTQSAECSIERKGRKGVLKVIYSCDSPPPAGNNEPTPEPLGYPMPPI